MPLNIPALAKSLTATAYEIADSVMTDAVLEVSPAGSGLISDYNPASDTLAGSTTQYSVRGLVYQAKAQKLSADSAKLATFMVQAEDAGLPFAPTNLNCFVTFGGVRWNARLVEYVPGDPIFIFELRRT
jgi:hypothetical protein